MAVLFFVPVVPLVGEIALANGWHDEYMRLAEVVDSHAAGEPEGGGEPQR